LFLPPEEDEPPARLQYLIDKESIIYSGELLRRLKKR